MKVEIRSLIIASLLIWVWNLPSMANSLLSENTLSTSDFYSGRDDLRTIGLGRSAYTEDGNGVTVDIYQKTDGTYVVKVIEHYIEHGRQRSTISKEYITAWKNKEGRICFTWKNKEYRTARQTIRD